MSPSIICFPTPGKDKSRRLLEAFAEGSGVQTSARAAAFYGVTPGNLQAWNAVRAAGGDWYYLDNSYFDATRGTHFRVTRNALQAKGLEAADWGRFAALDVAVQPWTFTGRHIVVCPQSDWFLGGLCGLEGGAGGWLERTLATLRKHTRRAIVVRHWKRDKAAAAADLAHDLAGAWALVTHMSAAANEALLAGIPVFTTGICAATVMGSSELELIERPRRPDGRTAWAAALAGQQWTEPELRDGTAWRALHGDRGRADGGGHGAPASPANGAPGAPNARAG